METIGGRGGVAVAGAVIVLRRKEFQGKIVLIAAEDHLPDTAERSSP